MRLIDADALVGWLKGAGSYLKGLENHKPLTKAIGVIINHIEDQPTIDAVEVVRCKDCKYWDDDRRCNGIENGLVREYTLDDDFCSYGERKTEWQKQY